MMPALLSDLPSDLACPRDESRVRARSLDVLDEAPELVMRTTCADDASFHQERLARSFACTAGVGWLSLACRLPEHLVRGSSLGDASLSAHGAAAALPLAAWLFLRTRRAPLSAGALNALDAAVLLGSSLAYAAMGRALVESGIDVALARRADLLVVLATSFAMLTRAMLVPSSGRRTLALSLGCSLGLLLLVLPGGGSAATRLVLDVAMWGTLATGLATLTSSTIFGLRREARETRRLGQYVLEEKIGEGGMGVVHRASHLMLRRKAAVKLLHPGRTSAASVSRFEREVRETARLSHPNTVTIFDYGRTSDGVFYYAMELLDGLTLEAVLAAGGPLPPRRVVHVLRQVASALVEAHDAGLVHRDIKPSNILLCSRGGVLDVAKVLDFGLVCEMAVEPARGSGGDVPGERRPLAGTPPYLAPEGFSGEASPATDLYALGVLGYQLLTGEVPFAGRTLVELCAQHQVARPERPSARAPFAVPPALDRLVMACLAKRPEDRPASARAVAQALSAIEGPAWTEDDASSWWRAYGARQH